MSSTTWTWFLLTRKTGGTSSSKRSQCTAFKKLRNLHKLLLPWLGNDQKNFGLSGIGEHRSSNLAWCAFLYITLQRSDALVMYRVLFCLCSFHPHFHLQSDQETNHDNAGIVALFRLVHLSFLVRLCGITIYLLIFCFIVLPFNKFSWTRYGLQVDVLLAACWFCTKARNLNKLWLETVWTNNTGM